MILRRTLALAAFLAAAPLLEPPPTPEPNDLKGPFPEAWTTLGPKFNSEFGRVVAPAGDVNGDGFGDVLVSAQWDSVSFAVEGRVFLYLGSAQGLAQVPAWTWRGDQPGARAGASIASAGDVNGDGYFDVLVGVTRWSQAAGKVAVFHGSASGLPATPTYERMSPAPAADQLFGQVATAGDVNGDGYSDAIVGAYGYSDGTITARGAVYVYLGGPGGLNAAPARTLLGDQSQAQFGLSVATAGDVNADGFDDILIGAPNRSSGGFSGNGAVWLFLGSAGGIPAVADTMLVGENQSARFGQSLSTAGDFTGDGYADVIIGQPGYDDTVLQGGRADVWTGGPTGLVARQFLVHGSVHGANAGASVATVGDLDADGYADVAVGAPLFPPPTGPGVVHVFMGAPGAGFYRGSIPGDPSTAGEFGTCVAASGDVNGDGYSELLVGDPLGNGPGASGFGRATLITLNERPISAAIGWPLAPGEAGSRAGNGLAILPQHDNGSFPQLVIGSPNRAGGGAFEFFRGRKGGANPVVERGVYGSLGSELGTCVVDAGDVNRDGYSDLLVSQPRSFSTGGAESGMVILYLGTGGAPGSGAIALEGDQPFTWLGTALAGRGDVNGDGYQDFLMASSWWNGPGVPGCGKVWLTYGSANAPQAPGWSVVGTLPSQGLGASVALCDLDADGYSDVVIGSAAPSDAVNPGNGKVEVHYGGPGGAAAAPGLVLVGRPQSRSFGMTLAALGDVTGDGVCDLGIGAPDEADVGRLYVFAGSLGRSQARVPRWSLAGTQFQGRLGTAIAGGGDFTGDGIADFAIGEPGWDDGSSDEGRMFLFAGGVEAPSTVPLLILEGNALGARLGAAFAPLADLDLDGLADLVVGAPGGASRVFLLIGAPPGGGLSRRLRLLEDSIQSPRRFRPARLDSPNLLAGGMILRSPAGRAKVGTRIERRTQNTAFTGVPTNASGFVDSGTPGFPSETFATITLPWPGRGYHVRGRLVTNSPFFQRSRWITPEGHVSGDLDVWSSGLVVDASNPRATAGVARLAGIAPNPSSAVTQGGSMRIAFSLPRPVAITLDVHDVRGMRVRRLLGGMQPAGVSSVAWDGRDDAGRATAAGVYFVQLRAGAESDRAKLVRLP